MLLQWCPVCFQKFLLTLNDLENFKNLKEETDTDKCMMCKNKFIVKIEKWPRFTRILGDFDTEHGVSMCLNCIYVIDTIHKIKEKVYLRFVSI